MAGPPEQPRREVTLQGIGVSPGIAVGDVFLFKTEDDRPVEREIAAEEIPREIARFEESLIETRRQIHEIQKQVGSAIGQENASIFDAHLLVVDDRSFVEEVIRGLGLQHKNVETVLRVVADKYAQALLRVEDDYLRERAADVRDVTRRILRNLVGQVGMTLDQIPAPCLLVANDLAPSEAAMLSKSKVTGFATDLGSPTSHTAIMARALRIPAVVGLHDVSSRLQHGDRVLIDGTKGVLVVNPSTALLERYGHVAEVRRSIETSLARLRLEPAETLDGYRLLLSANIELPSDVEAVLASGAAGVGLFRSEYLYLSSKGLPSEDEQTEAYAQVAQRLHPEPAIIRTLDLGGDKFASQLKTPQEMNPFMGWRAIRFCLAQPDIFKTQLRALLRASVSDTSSRPSPSAKAILTKLPIPFPTPSSTPASRSTSRAASPAKPS
jgi:phosphotransferase system enzyme I (PtsI)